MEFTGLPARELTDEELERQGTHAHATRNWVFLHGTADQFRHHTDRMLELEQEYLRRHPKRTWQGTSDDAEDVDEATRLRAALRSVISQVEALLVEGEQPATPRPGLPDGITALLRTVADIPGGRMNRLELHQAARQHKVDRTQLAQLYRRSPALLAVDGADRMLTEAGRAWLAARIDRPTDRTNVAE